jgi:hypothetical protein
MAPTTHANFFILAPIGEPRTIHEKELEKAQLRAHAARISYQRRNLARVKCPRRRKDAQSRQTAYSKREDDIQSKSDPPVHDVWPLGVGFCGSSDPFDMFAIKVTPGELVGGVQSQGHRLLELRSMFWLCRWWLTAVCRNQSDHFLYPRCTPSASLLCAILSAPHHAHAQGD